MAKRDSKFLPAGTVRIKLPREEQDSDSGFPKSQMKLAQEKGSI